MGVARVVAWFAASRGFFRTSRPGFAFAEPGYTLGMVLYRRARVPGGTFFFTVTLADRRVDTQTTHVSELREAFRATRRQRPFTIEAIVIPPDHLHALWTLPPSDTDYATRWQAIKTRFTQYVAANGALPRHANGEPRLWQRRYWEHAIRDETDWARHVDYIHYNPVKHGYVRRVADWPRSSFHRYARRGDLPLDWGGDRAADSSGFGERPDS